MPFAKPCTNVTRTLCLCCLLVVLAGCVTSRVTYLRGDEELIPVKKGQVVPFDGWLVSPQEMAEIFDRLDKPEKEDKQ